MYQALKKWLRASDDDMIGFGVLAAILLLSLGMLLLVYSKLNPIAEKLNMALDKFNSAEVVIYYKPIPVENGLNSVSDMPFYISPDIGESKH